MTESTPKIRGFVASQNNKIVFLYRRSNKITYLALLSYGKGKEYLQVGSRFYGRIYPERCDISLDGKYFLYFAMGSSQQQYRKQLYCWTGICTPPSITANILFAHGDTWGGGGTFIDRGTIFISPGMYPDFDRHSSYLFEKYKITFEENYRNWGKTWSKGWKLIETQAHPRYGDRYPVPKYWTKKNGKFTLIRHSNRDLFLKSKNGQTIGSYDLYSYEIENNQQTVKYSLDREDTPCLWADFDNLGRLIVTRGSKIFIYQNFQDAVDRIHHSSFDLEELITLPINRSKE